MKKWKLNKTLICSDCIGKLESFSKFHAKEYVLTCMHYSDGSPRCILPKECLKEILEELETLGYIVTTEYSKDWLKIKPLGHSRFSFSEHQYCLCENKKP